MNEDRATRYHRLCRYARVLSVGLAGGLFIALWTTGASIGLRHLLEVGVRRANISAPFDLPAAVFGYVLVVAVAMELLILPPAFYRGFVLERRYGLSRETATAWLRDHLKAAAVGLTFSVGAAEVVYAALHRWPTWWWAPAGAAMSAVGIGLATVAPVVLLPLFYRFTPLAHEKLRARLMTLARRAGARVVGAYEWKLGDRTRKANAALTGLGATRRILVSDTLLSEYSDDEIEVVLAHELGHHVHRDMWTGLASESAIIFAGLYGASRLITALGSSSGLTAPDDVAGLPLVVLAAGAVSIVLKPATNALSRAHELSADRFALDLTRNPDAFVCAMRRLGAQNLAEEQPSRLVRTLLYTHPPIAERIARAREWARLDSTDRDGARLGVHEREAAP